MIEKSGGRRSAIFVLIARSDVDDETYFIIPHINQKLKSQMKKTNLKDKSYFRVFMRSFVFENHEISLQVRKF